MSRKIRRVSIDEDFKSLIDEIDKTGEELIVTKDDRAIARIAPIGGVPSLRGSVLYQGDLISPIDEEWLVDRQDE